MSTLIELAANLVTSQAVNNPMTVDQMISEVRKVHAGLKQLEFGKQVQTDEVKTISIKGAFRKNEVVCLVCGKGGFKTLTRHLSVVHDMKPGEYRRQFGIPRTQSLTAKSYSDARRKSAMERGLPEKLAMARELRTTKVGEKVALVEEKQVTEVAEAM